MRKSQEGNILFIKTLSQKTGELVLNTICFHINSLHMHIQRSLFSLNK